MNNRKQTHIIFILPNTWHFAKAFPDYFGSIKPNNMMEMHAFFIDFHIFFAVSMKNCTC